MILPIKSIQLLKALFANILSDEAEVEKQLNVVNNSFSILFISEIAQQLTKEQQQEFISKVKELKKEEYTETVNALIKKYLSDEKIKEIYNKTMEKVMTTALEPLIKEFTPQQKKQFQQITDQYLQ